jgi:arginase
VHGIPLWFGQPKPGAHRGADVLRHSRLMDLLNAQKLDVEDHGDVAVPTYELTEESLDGLSPDERCQETARVVGGSCENLFNAMTRSLAQGNFCLTLGGDHSSAIGSGAAGLSHFGGDDFGIIWVDAHADINTLGTSPSKNIHGMPVSFLMNLEDQRAQLAPFAWMHELPVLKPENIVFIGLRQVDDGEADFIRELGITAYDMASVDKLGVAEVMRRTLAQLRGKNLHMSFDIDALDPAHAPSTGTVVTGGLTLREGMTICEEAANSGRLSSFDLMEVNPDIKNLYTALSRDHVEATQITARSALSMTLCALKGNRNVY